MHGGKGTHREQKNHDSRDYYNLPHSDFKAMYTHNAKYLVLSYYYTSNSPFGFVLLLAPFYK